MLRETNSQKGTSQNFFSRDPCWNKKEIPESSKDIKFFEPPKKPRKEQTVKGAEILPPKRRVNGIGIMMVGRWSSPFGTGKLSEVFAFKLPGSTFYTKTMQTSKIRTPPNESSAFFSLTKTYSSLAGIYQKLKVDTYFFSLPSSKLT